MDKSSKERFLTLVSKEDADIVCNIAWLTNRINNKAFYRGLQKAVFDFLMYVDDTKISFLDFAINHDIKPELLERFIHAKLEPNENEIVEKIKKIIK